jgi:hypothetical protein
MTDMEAIYRDALTTRLHAPHEARAAARPQEPGAGHLLVARARAEGVSAEGTDEKTRAQVEKAVTMARKELARLERTSRTFLADAGIADEGEARFDIADLAKETVRHFVTDAAMRNVRLTVDVPPERSTCARRAPRSRRPCSPACCTRSTRCPRAASRRCSCGARTTTS